MRLLSVVFATLLLLRTSTDSVSVLEEDNGGCGCSAKTTRQVDPTLTTFNKDLSATSYDAAEYTLEKMVKINGGLGFIGTNDPKISRDGEGPQRRIELSSFLIDKYEVSNNGKYCTTIHTAKTANIVNFISF